MLHRTLNHAGAGPRQLPVRAARVAGTGLLLGFSFLPVTWLPTGATAVLAWIAFVPLLQSWNEYTEGVLVLLDSYLAVLLAYLIAFSWVLNHYFAITVFASLGGLLLMPLFTAAPFAVSWWFRRRYGYLIGGTALVAFVLAAEWTLSHGPLAFPWALLGHTQAPLFPFNQWAAWLGVPGLSCWVLLLNVAAHSALYLKRRWVKGFAVASFLALVGTVGTFGLWQRAYPLAAAAHTSALIVQPALEAATWSDVHNAERVHRLLRASNAALDTTARPPDLVLWPETALPPAASQPDAFPAVERWSSRRAVPVLTGAVRTADSLAGSRITYFNSAVLIRPDTASSSYDKVKLVPFAEHVPFVDRLPALRMLTVPAGGVAGYEAGTGPRALRTPSSVLAPLICFESTFGVLTRRYVRTAPDLDFFAVLSQDGWWGPTPGHRQHLAITRLRAIETSRAVVVATVSGISALIDANGQVVHATDWMERTALRVRIPHYTGTTVYVQYGAWIGRVPLMVTVLFVLLWLVAPLGSPADGRS